MKNLKLTLFLFLLSSICITQFSLAQYSYRGKQANSVDIVVSGDLGYRLISPLSTSGESLERNRRTAESFKFNYKAGVNFNYGLNGSLLIKTGIRIANPGFSISTVEKIDFTQEINDIVKLPLMLGDAEGFRYRVQYNLLQIPLGIKYVALGGFCEPYFELGIMPSFYGGTKVHQINANGSRGTAINIEENINKVNFISFISAGGNYRITDDFSAFTQVVANYQLNNLRIGDLSERLVSIGIELGVRKYL